jgi:hypothetical protein
MFSGFVALGDTLTLFVLVSDTDHAPVEPDAAPTFRIYGASGLLSSAGGTCSLAHTGTVTGATNANPIVVASAAHGLASGQVVNLASVGGNTNANGTHTITVVDSDHFSLNGVAGNGNYTSGGTWHVSGFYKAAITVSGGNGFESGENFVCHLSWAVSSAARAQVQAFGVT